ncbi:MAG: magnesium protoporphyrin IX methyltransferase [Proteobacteria bacterium]|nr:magnesium protoporphyrin IX methyltransferase [Pseudomonadota bacterium]
MNSTTYDRRRGQLEDYFGRTGYEAWARLTADGPVSRIRATVRAGRQEMRDQLLDWLPAQLRGLKVLDAGCGTGALAWAAAARGAEVTAVDLTSSVVRLAQERAPAIAGPGRIEYGVGDMTDASWGSFDYVVAMDSLIHYDTPDMVEAVQRLARRTRCAILFTFAPRTGALAVMHAVGRLFPRGDRAPAIAPVREAHLAALLTAAPGLEEWEMQRSQRVQRGFYTSQAVELVHR